MKKEFEIDKNRQLRIRRIMRALTPKQRAFVRILKRVVETVPGTEFDQREKIMKALNIRGRMYQIYLQDIARKVAQMGY